MSKKEMYRRYRQDWKATHNEGKPACYEEWLDNEFINIELEDDNTETGGISHIGETLGEFLSETELFNRSDIRNINKALKECGIKEIR